MLLDNMVEIDQFLVDVGNYCRPDPSFIFQVDKQRPTPDKRLKIGIPAGRQATLEFGEKLPFPARPFDEGRALCPGCVHL
jgi:hypothetical protein